MIIFTVPARNDLPRYRFQTSISGVVYTLRFNFNSRMNRWTMDIADPANNDIVNGLPVLLYRDLASQFFYLSVPPGTFFATDDTNSNTQPTRLSFGTDHSLIYADPTQ